VPEELDVHLIVDNTCTYASWLNQVERWFGIITQRAIRRGSFSSVKELVARIEQFVAAYNNKTKAPFSWTASADSILEKLQRLCAQISGVGTLGKL
jgi:putative transposase